MEQKAQILSQAPSVIGRYVRLRKHSRRVGKFGTVQDLFWKGDEPWLVLQLPSGSRVAVAASWTDLPHCTYLIKKNTPELRPDGLVEVAKFLQGMTSRRRRPVSARKRKKKT